MSGKPLHVLLIGTYELGRQPFGLASAAAWLRREGATVTCLDLAVEQVQDEAVRAADLVAFHVPMHTATRLAAALVGRIRALNARVHLCFFGLYAPMNEQYLRSLGAGTILGGEFEAGLAALAARLQTDGARAVKAPQERESVTREAQVGGPGAGPQALREQEAASGPVGGPGAGQELVISLAKQAFLLPDRSGLPELARYAYLDTGDGERRTVGYTEASRGCKHRCRHCPVVPVYGGVFRVVQAEIVLEDIAQQVAAGARHITFGDPDFFNGPGHALRIVQALHQRFPALTYDVTIKIEHLLQQAQSLPLLQQTGCLLITSAVEAVDEATLAIFDKRHSRADFVQAVALCREAGIALNPTFVTFTPWTMLEGFRDLLALIEDLDLVEHIAPIQYAIRLLIPEGSLLLELAEVRNLVGPFDRPALCYPWRHPDRRVDDLYEAVRAVVQRGTAAGEGRRAIFNKIWALARAAAEEPLPAARHHGEAAWSGQRGTILDAGQMPPVAATGWHRKVVAPRRRSDVTTVAAPPAGPIPRLSEAWYC